MVSPRNKDTYENTKALVHSSDNDTDFFNIINGVSQGDTFEVYLLIICLDYVL